MSMFESVHEFWYRIRARFQRDGLDAELAEELRAHAQFLEEEAIRNGASPSDAKRAASQRLGNVINIRERTRERWSFGWVEALLQDTRYAFRFLLRSPGFTAVAVLSLALGIGANATVFTVADKLLFSAPAHVSNANELHLLNIKRASEPGGDAPYATGATFAEYIALNTSARSLAAVALYTPPQAVRVGRGSEAPRIRESIVSTNFFDVIGVRPLKGRFLEPVDDSLGNSVQAAVISYAFWQRYFAGADSAVGSRYTASDINFIIVGIAPKDFTGTDIDAPDVWVPLFAVAPVRVQREWQKWVGATSHVLVRLTKGTAPETAAAEATVILRRLPERRRAIIEETAAFGPIIAARGPADQTDAVKVSTKLVMASSLVLLAACANLANLLLVRALTRRREIALRLAIGVSRSRLVSQMLLESLLIAFTGSLTALAVARWSGDALRKLVFPNVQWGTNTVDVRVFLFAVLCGTVVAVVATMAPAIHMTRSDVASALRSAAPQLTASTGRLRQGLLSFQVALSVVLIIGAFAFSRSLNEAYEFDLGFDADRMITTRIFIEADSIAAPAQVTMLEEGARRVRNLPGVELVALSGIFPLTGNASVSITTPERPRSAIGGGRWDMTPALMRSAGFHLVRGRLITDADVSRGTNGPILLTEAAARKLWPESDPIGRCARLGGDSTPCLTVIGIVRDLRQFSVRDKAVTGVLVGVAEPKFSQLGAYIVTRMRAGANQAALIAQIRRTLRDVRPDIRSLEVQPLRQALERDFQPLRLGKITIGTFALLAIILAAIGLYGILAFSVAQRTNEFGIRSALGAQARDLVASVVREGMVVVVAGVVLGGAISWYVSIAIEALLFQSSARDTMPYLYAATVLGLVARAASIVPAWRATRVDPAIALRAE